MSYDNYFVGHPVEVVKLAAAPGGNHGLQVTAGEQKNPACTTQAPGAHSYFVGTPLIPEGKQLQAAPAPAAASPSPPPPPMDHWRNAFLVYLVEELMSAEIITSCGHRGAGCHSESRGFSKENGWGSFNLYLNCVRRKLHFFSSTLDD